MTEEEIQLKKAELTLALAQDNLDRLEAEDPGGGKGFVSQREFAEARYAVEIAKLDVESAKLKVQK